MTTKDVLALALEALEHAVKWLNVCDKPKECMPLHAAITAIKQAQGNSDSTCKETSRLQGKVYPRTCKKCGLGPCVGKPIEQAQEQQKAIVSRDADADHRVKLSVYGDHIHPSAAGRAVVAKAFELAASKMPKVQSKSSDPNSIVVENITVVETVGPTGVWVGEPQAITLETGNAANPEASAITAGNGQAQEPVAWQYENTHGAKFLTFDDPNKWHPHEKDGFRNFKALIFKECAHPAPKQAEPRLPEFFAQYEYDTPNWDVVVSVYQRHPDKLPSLVHKQTLPAQQAEPAWQPIESAPKDGRMAIVYRPLASKTHDPEIAIKRLVGGPDDCWDKTVPAGHKKANPTDGYCHCTHWLPLPTPPEAA